MYKKCRRHTAYSLLCRNILIDFPKINIYNMTILSKDGKEVYTMREIYSIVIFMLLLLLLIIAVK